MPKRRRQLSIDERPGSTETLSLYSRYGSSSLNADELLDPEESEQLRDDYLERIESRDAPARLRELVDVVDAASQRSVEAREVSIKVGRAFHRLSTRSSFTIGRKSWCDVPLPSKQGVSRCHAIVSLYDDALVVYDPGSFIGTRTLERSNDGDELLDSMPGARRALSFGRDETVVLEMGMVRVTLNPRVCIVCEEQPREVVFEPCRHFTMCSVCADCCSVCPLCRAPRDNTTTVDRVSTFANVGHDE